MPSLPSRAVHAAARRLQSLPRRARARLARTPVTEEPVELLSGAGYPLYAHVHRPSGVPGPLPGVLLCPGIDEPGTVFDDWSQPLSADEVARLGCVVMHFDPAGRGRSWGREDYGGPEHQDDVRVALRHLLGLPEVDPARSGVVAISLGIAMAAGALADPEPGVEPGWLIDWEGPCDREIITSGGRILAPADGHALDDEAYWRPREAVRHIGRIRCGYFRYQARRDHAQPGELRHAIRMMEAVRQGRAVWFQLNDHPRGTFPPIPRWYPSGTLAANRVLLSKIRSISIG